MFVNNLFKSDYTKNLCHTACLENRSIAIPFPHRWPARHSFIGGDYVQIFLTYYQLFWLDDSIENIDVVKIILRDAAGAAGMAEVEPRSLDG